MHITTTMSWRFDAKVTYLGNPYLIMSRAHVLTAGACQSELPKKKKK